MKNIIAVDNLTKEFKDLTAVKGVSFDVHEGEIFGFLGPNGAGKTTTINMITTLLTPTAGRARVGGYDIVKRRRRVRRQIGIIFQEPSLDQELNAEENMIFHSMLYDVPLKVARGRIRETLEMVELYDRRKTVVKRFSGGMKRRLEIARGLIHKPRVLFLDEPTLGLDPQTRNRIWDYIMRVRGEKSMTIFLTTHYMEEAEICDRIAIIDNGQIIACDTPLNLKMKVGGEVVKLKTSNNELAMAEIQKHFNIIPKIKGDRITFSHRNGGGFIEKMIPELFAKVTPRILSISAHHPTLNDVFLVLTGKEIRDGMVAPGKTKERIKQISKKVGLH